MPMSTGGDAAPEASFYAAVDPAAPVLRGQCCGNFLLDIQLQRFTFSS
jgi:hypothetical protein